MRCGETMVKVNKTKKRGIVDSIFVNNILTTQTMPDPQVLLQRAKTLAFREERYLRKEKEYRVIVYISNSKRMKYINNITPHC